jgi:hypothetical protein
MSVPVYTNYPSYIPYNYNPVLNTYVSPSNITSNITPNLISPGYDYIESYNDLQPIYTVKPESVQIPIEPESQPNVSIETFNKKSIQVFFIIVGLIIGGTLLLIYRKRL